MSKATLTFVLNKGVDEDNSVLYLESGSLRYVDHCTKRYKNEEELKNSALYRPKIEEFIRKSGTKGDGQFYVSYIEDSDRREVVPILFNDDKDIVTMLGVDGTATNEVEKARHLLWTSKDNRYLKNFLEDERFSDTTFFNIKLSSTKEYKAALEAELKPKLINGDNYLSIEDILHYKLDSSYKKLMRSLIEDALEVWKEKLYELDGDSLYYYARHLRLLEQEYEDYLDEKKTVVDLEIDSKNLYNVVLDGAVLIEIPVSGRHTYQSGYKQKILSDDRKAA